MTPATPDPSEPDALVTLDLTSAAPANRFTRTVLAIILSIVFGALALACAVLYYGYAFIPAAAGWAVAIDWVAPIVGVLSLCIALLGLEFVRRSRRNSSSGPTVFDTAAEVIEAVVPDEDGPEPLSAAPTPTPPSIL